MSSEADVLYDPINKLDTAGGFADSVGAHLTVAGWGTTTEGGQPSDVPLRVRVPIVTNAQCNDAYGTGSIAAGMVCAGFPDGQRDSCQGDSGGPLFGVDSNGQYVLVGVVSWGFGCARPGYPGVYTRVSAYKIWICANSANTPVFCGGGDGGGGDASPPSPSPPPPTPVAGSVNIYGYYRTTWQNGGLVRYEPTMESGYPIAVTGLSASFPRSLGRLTNAPDGSPQIELVLYGQVTIGRLTLSPNREITTVQYPSDVQHIRVEAPGSPSPPPPSPPPSPPPPRPSPPSPSPPPPPGPVVASPYPPTTSAPSPPAGICTNTCQHAGDTDCDDGGFGADYQACDFGTDCNDCGPRGSPPSVASPPMPAPIATSPAPAGNALCNDQCQYSGDGDCDDGGPGAEYFESCPLGSDCTDCGTRYINTPPSPPPAMRIDLTGNYTALTSIGLLYIGIEHCARPPFPSDPPVPAERILLHPYCSIWCHS